jgi:hypothetical protein
LVAKSIEWLAIVALGIGDVAGFYWARVITALIFVAWLALVVVPWAFSWVPSSGSDRAQARR